MKLLLDTHVWIWSQEVPDKLGSKTQTALLTPGNDLYISTISTLELARLSWLGRIQFRQQLGAWVKRSLELLKADMVVLNHEIGLESYCLPEPFHRDPADRILVATARTLGMKLLTVDDAILNYHHVSSMDARQ